MDLKQFFNIGMDRDIPTPLDHPVGPVINLGHGAKVFHSISVEGGHRAPISIGLPEWDANRDLIPYKDGTVACIWALHFLEHINNAIGVLRECQRVLMPGGVMNICVPYGTSHMAVQDLSHVNFFNEDTWKELFNNPYYDDHGDWKFAVNTNVVMAVKGTNLALLTQLVRMV